MAGCSITQDLTLGCKDIGGIETVYLGSYNLDTTSPMTFIFSTASATLNLITSFGGTTASMYILPQPINVGELTAPAEVNTENNTIGYTQTLKFGVYSLSAFNINTIKMIGQGVFFLMVKARNGRFFFLGAESPCQVTAIDAGLGKGMSDLNGAMITMSALGTQPTFEVSAAAAASLIS